MQEATIDCIQLTELAVRLSKSPDIMRKAKARAFEAAAPRLLELVDSEIGGTGKVQSWQDKFVGSKGGYAAVRAKAKTKATDAKGRETEYQVGYVTNAIASGHKFPSPSGKNQRYKPRIRSGRQNVPGKHFYENAQVKATAIAQEAAEQVVEELMSFLEE